MSLFPAYSNEESTPQSTEPGKEEILSVLLNHETHTGE